MDSDFKPGPQSVTNEQNITFDPNGGWSKGLTEHAAKKGFENIKACLVTFPNGDKEYLLVEDGIPIKASTSIETLAAYLDMMKINRDIP